MELSHTATAQALLRLYSNTAAALALTRCLCVFVTIFGGALRPAEVG